MSSVLTIHYNKSSNYNVESTTQALYCRRGTLLHVYNCDNIGLVSLILLGLEFTCVLYHSTMCTRHPNLVSFAFYAIPIFHIIISRIFNLLVIIQCIVFASKLPMQSMYVHLSYTNSPNYLFFAAHGNAGYLHRYDQQI